MTNSHNPQPTILDLAAYKSINELQATAKTILGDSKANDDAILLLAQLETMLITSAGSEYFVIQSQGQINLDFDEVGGV